MTATSTPVRTSPVRRRQGHTTYRRSNPGPSGFRPGGPSGRQVAGAGPHRLRTGPLRCDDPRARARAAAVRRRHILLAVVAVAVLLTLAFAGGGKGSSGLAAPGPVRTGSVLTAHSEYIVRPGDTLWSIAERLDPRGDPRPLMAKLSRQAGGDTVRPGERLILP